MSNPRELFAALDADKPETVNAVLDYIRACLGRGDCPMCSSPGSIRKTLIAGVVAADCLVCPYAAPPPPDGDVAEISDGVRRKVARALWLSWELFRD